MKAEKLAAEKPAETKRDNAAPASKTIKQNNNQPSAVEEKRKLPWELVFLFVVMGLTMIVIALKAFSII
ncbi:MAG: hypothetical protein ACM3P0_07880 [Acidobacteriota bacterium]